MSHDQEYYAMRATEERRLAMSSDDLRVRRAHLELAGNYAKLAGSKIDLDAEPIVDMPNPTEQTG